jgi:hypothetical protein
MNQLNYQELCNNNEGHWLTEGPNSEGQAGWILRGGCMFFYRGDWSISEPVVQPGITITAFLQWHQSDTNERVLLVSQELQKRSDLNI